MKVKIIEKNNKRVLTEDGRDSIINTKLATTNQGLGRVFCLKTELGSANANRIKGYPGCVRKGSKELSSTEYVFSLIINFEELAFMPMAFGTPDDIPNLYKGEIGIKRY